ncbi:unnamed protein product [Staurois parvus]|uniref:Uncharacterized protein n=1 Tax=Staurois parvus TaxID=386267 RepID=A0ABN9F9K4_9NEOB|nr:unnamed protein product [Staurois parvus]
MGPYIPPPHAAARPLICHGPLYRPPHAAARPLICHGPLYTASSCCCQVQSLSWVPVRPPIAAVSIATLCHVPLSGLLTLLVCSNFLNRVLADYGPPIAAARPLICHGPLYTASSCCCQVQSLSWVPVRPPIAAVSIATLCHVPLSGLLTHCWCV